MLPILLCLMIFLQTSLFGQVQVADSFAKTTDQYVSLGQAELGLMRGDALKALSSLQKYFASGGSTTGVKILWRLLALSGQHQMLSHQKNIFEDDIELQKMYLQALMVTQQKEKAQALLSRLQDKFPQNPELVFMAASYASMLGNNDQALTILNNFLTADKNKRRFAQFIFLKAKLLYSLGRFLDVLKTLQESQEITSRLPQVYALEGLTHEKMNNINFAIKSYKLFLLKSSVLQVGIQKHLIYLLFKNNRFAEAKEILQTQSQNTGEYFFDLALIEWKNDELESALVHAQKAINLDDTLFAAQLLKLQLLLSLQNEDKALHALRDWLGQSPDITQPVKALFLLHRVGISCTSLQGILKDVLMSSPKNKQLLAALGDLCLLEQDYDHAYAYYKQILPLVRDDELKASLLYAMSYGLFKSKKFEEIASLLLEAKKLTKNNESSVDNFLAYIYAITQTNLEQAVLLVDRLLATHDHNPNFLDTKGFVLLGQGDYRGAQTFFRKALAVAPDDLVIQEHYKRAQS